MTDEQQPRPQRKGTDSTCPHHHQDHRHSALCRLIDMVPDIDHALCKLTQMVKVELFETIMRGLPQQQVWRGRKHEHNPASSSNQYRATVHPLTRERVELHKWPEKWEP